MTTIGKTTVRHNLCIGCGLCAAACPSDAISLEWSRLLTWVPSIDSAKCTECGACVSVCPNTPERIVEYVGKAFAAGERFGLPDTAEYFIAHDADAEGRLRSASGGALTALLKHLLAIGEIDGVVACVPVSAPLGSPHYELKLVSSCDELENARSSCYYPLRYDKVLGQIARSSGKYALVGVPCVLRGAVHLPAAIKDKIRYTFGLVCSHNVTGGFLDCLARQEGVREGEEFTANLREKTGIPDASNYNVHFALADREIRRNRFDTAHTDMWRAYFFAQECCLYCPDFYAADADLSVKDAWGRLSGDPLGLSLLVVRNPELSATLRDMAAEDKLHLEQCDSDEVFNSQKETAAFKHVEVRHRLNWKNALRSRLAREKSPLILPRRWWGWESDSYWRLRTIAGLSKAWYSRTGRISVKKVLLAGRLVVLSKQIARRLVIMTRPPRRLLSKCARALMFWKPDPGPPKPLIKRSPGGLRVLIAGGYGYMNIGDEAQLAANIEHWKAAEPECRITVLTPDPDYTERLHLVRTELAPRVVFFLTNRKPGYGGSTWKFKLGFMLLAPRLLFNAWLMRRGLPVFGVSAAQARLLGVIQESDVLFLSGGGYLTGGTLSRLWDNMLLIRLAHVFGVPAVLSGQTVGVFGGFLSRMLARWGLRAAQLIYLRDSGYSQADVESLGISGNHVQSTFDDAFFFAGAPASEVKGVLLRSGIDPRKPYMAVNIHDWGQSPEDYAKTMEQIASALDEISERLRVQVAFVAMNQVDEPSIERVIGLMRKPGHVVLHDYNMGAAVGVIRAARLCMTMKHHPIVFAMGGAVPTVSIAVTDYYVHKNTGAMGIFGQERYSVSGPVEGLAERLIEKALLAWENQDEERAAIREVIERMSPRAGEAVYRWVEMIKPPPVA